MARGLRAVLDAEFLERATAGRRRGWQFAISHVLTPTTLVLVAGVEDRVLAFSHSGPPDDGRAALEIFGFYCHRKHRDRAWHRAVGSARCASRTVNEFGGRQTSRSSNDHA
jgi:hypothetical protein